MALGFMAVLFSAGCGSAQAIIEKQGPDATLARMPVDSGNGIWPSEDLRAIVVRPTFDESPAGVVTFDGRTTMAILDPDRATWVMGARLTDQQGLNLVDQLQQLIVQDSLSEDDGHHLEAHLLRQPEDGSSSMAIEGGQWRLLTSDASTSVGTIRLGIVKGQAGELVAETTMDPVAARDLMHRLAAAIRSPGS